MYRKKFLKMPPDSLQELHNELLALQNALEASGNGFIQINHDDTLACDATSKELLRLTSGELLSDLPDFLMCIKESEHERVIDSLDAARTHNERIELELELERQNKSPHARLLLSAQATRLPGYPGTSICGTLKSVSEGPTTESKSDATLDEVRSSNLELANFAAIASHDMREPLRMITSYLHLLQERSPEALDDRARRYIGYACEGADRMRTLIEDLLSYARLDKLEKELEALDLGDLLSTSIDNLQAIILESKAEVTVDIDQAPIVMGDKVRLVRLFQNLLANGIKFKQPERNARVNVSFKDGDHVGNPGKWVVCIEDHGIGIDPDHHEVLFSLFQRLNTRDEFEGSGIGLAVCKKIAEQHGGKIWFNSTKGKGSIFYVALEKAAPDSLK